MVREKAGTMPSAAHGYLSHICEQILDSYRICVNPTMGFELDTIGTLVPRRGSAMLIRFEWAPWASPHGSHVGPTRACYLNPLCNINVRVHLTRVTRK